MVWLGITTVDGTYQSVLKWSHDFGDFSDSWPMGDEWGVMEAWSAVVCQRWIMWLYKFIYIRASWSWSYGSWTYNCSWNQYLSPQKLWDRTPLVARCTRFNTIWQENGNCFLKRHISANKWSIYVINIISNTNNDNKINKLFIIKHYHNSFVHSRAFVMYCIANYLIYILLVIYIQYLKCKNSYIVIKFKKQTPHYWKNSKSIRKIY